MKKLTIIDYGAGNVKSVAFAFERLGVTPHLSDDLEEIQSSDYVVFPGVGHANFAMEQLKAKNLIPVIKNLKQPVFGVCLGMQLMCDITAEGNVKGLGIFDIPVKKFDHGYKVPHMGWNTLENTKGILAGINEQVYFVHSYYVPNCEYTMASCNYYHDFSAALQKDNFMGCQFHPEKSGKVGAEILTRFLNS